MKKNILIITDDVHNTLGSAIQKILARENINHSLNIINNKSTGSMGYDYIPPLDDIATPKITVPLYNKIDADLYKVKGHYGSNYTPKKRKRK